jgi:hypothetical protein
MTLCHELSRTKDPTLSRLKAFADIKDTPSEGSPHGLVFLAVAGGEKRD